MEKKLKKSEKLVIEYEIKLSIATDKINILEANLERQGAINTRLEFDITKAREALRKIYTKKHVDPIAAEMILDDMDRDTEGCPPFPLYEGIIRFKRKAIAKDNHIEDLKAEVDNLKTDNDVKLDIIRLLQDEVGVLEDIPHCQFLKWGVSIKDLEKIEKWWPEVCRKD